MTEEQIVRYTELCKRRSELAICGGVNWKPEYGPELEQVERELSELQKIKDAAMADWEDRKLKGGGPDGQ